MTDEIIPISDEQAKAVQEAFKFGGQSLETARAFGGWLSRALGTVPEDLVGLLGGDWLRVKRADNIIKMGARARARLEARHVEEPEPIPLSVAIPLLTGAADEDREELVDLWARLMAAAMDPARRNGMRQEYIDIVNRLGPIDALILSVDAPNHNNAPHPHYARVLGLERDEIEVAILHLIDLGLMRDVRTRPGHPIIDVQSALLTTKGREFLRFVHD